MPKRWVDLRSRYSMPITESILPTKIDVLPDAVGHPLELGDVDLQEVADRELLPGAGHEVDAGGGERVSARAALSVRLTSLTMKLGAPSELTLSKRVDAGKIPQAGRLAARVHRRRQQIAQEHPAVLVGVLRESAVRPLVLDDSHAVALRNEEAEVDVAAHADDGCRSVATRWVSSRRVSRSSIRWRRFSISPAVPPASPPVSSGVTPASSGATGGTAAGCCARAAAGSPAASASCAATIASGRARAIIATGSHPWPGSHPWARPRPWARQRRAVAAPRSAPAGSGAPFSVPRKATEIGHLVVGQIEWLDLDRQVRRGAPASMQGAAAGVAGTAERQLEGVRRAGDAAHVVVLNDLGSVW